MDCASIVPNDGERRNDLGRPTAKSCESARGPNADRRAKSLTILVRERSTCGATAHGALVSNIVLDTSAAATDTIDYVASDSQGITSTSTRTVIVEPATDMLPSSSSDASSTAATSSVSQ